MKPIISKNASETQALGEAIARRIKNGMSIALVGDLGAGKTTFVQGLAKGLEIPEDYYITSPTFTLINSYPGKNFTLCHLDLYRLSDADELDYIGFDDLLVDANIIVVEWPQILNDISFDFDLEIHFKFDEDYNRRISLIPTGQAGANLLSSLIL